MRRNLEMEDKAFTSLGKEVLHYGKHFADAVSPEAAAVIAVCLNNSGWPSWKWPREEYEMVSEFFA